MHLRTPRPSPAMAVAMTALVVSAGGVAWAASTLPENSVGSAQIQNGSIRSGDIRDGNVRNADLGRNSVQGDKVAPDSLGGDKVIESDLGKVPSAADADRLGGRAASGYVRTDNLVAARRVVGANENVVLLREGPLTVRLACERQTNGDTTTRVYVQTTDSGTVLGGGSGGDNYDGSTSGPGFLPAGAAQEDATLVAQSSIGQAGQTDVDGVIDGAWVVAADGTYVSVDAETSVLGVNHLGGACSFIGTFTVLR